MTQRAFGLLAVVALSALVSTGSAAGADAAPSGPPRVALGPYLRFTAPDAAVVQWRTADPAPSILEYESGDAWRRVEDLEPKTSHALTLDGLKRNEMSAYRVLAPDGEAYARTEDYECDTAFNYTLPPVPEAPAYENEAAGTALFERLASELENPAGHGLVLGCGNGRLVYEMAKRSGLFVHGVDADPTVVAEARAALRQARSYGPRITVRHVESLARLPFTKWFANLVILDAARVSEEPLAVAQELYRVLRPGGGLACVLHPPERTTQLSAERLAAWAGEGKLAYQADLVDEGLWTFIRRPPLEGIGQWSHQYGSPDNSARSRETLGGATRTDQLEVQWVGRPGPRAMVDRNPRKPSPLYMNGRLFTQGLRRIIAQDAYNGAILWSLEVPGLQRYNMPRDCSNWCADKQRVYAVVKDACWALNAATGALEHVYAIAPTPPGAEYDWGYLAQAGDTLFGSALRKDTVYTNFWGKATAGWYDAPIGPVTYKVCSDALFALSKADGGVRWSYADGVLINPTITISGGRVYFVECRNEKVKAAATRRVGLKELWQDQFLVALDAATGAKVWERPLDTVDGTVVFYLLCADDTLVLALSRTKYHLYGFDAADGAPKWEASHDWTGNNHSGHMQHPAVVGNAVYLEPCGYDLDTGERVTDKVGRHEGCATYAAIENALLYRGTGRCISIWDPASGGVTRWERLRPGCWLSTMAGGGMVLSPEGGGGCSCGGWMETSLVFTPACK